MSEKYRWQSPLVWLLEKAGSWAHDRLLQEFHVVVKRLDGDTIQMLYQEEMDLDGYFDPIDDDEEEEDGKD